MANFLCGSHHPMMNFDCDLNHTTLAIIEQLSIQLVQQLNWRLRNITHCGIIFYPSRFYFNHL